MFYTRTFELFHKLLTILTFCLWHRTGDYSLYSDLPQFTKNVLVVSLVSSLENIPVQMYDKDIFREGGTNTIKK